MSSIGQQQSMMRQFWDKHPFLYEVAQVINEGNWINHLFEWVFMIISRLAAYGMTIAIGFLIYYAIETQHSLTTIPTGPHATWVDGVASFSSTVINVTPELVFPGVVVLCVKAFIARKRLDGWLYGLTAFGFGLLTMILLHAFMSSGINDTFLSAMLFWRAFAAIFYTVAVAICGSHGSLDLRTILKELDEAREEIAAREEREQVLRKQFDALNQRVTTLTKQLDHEKQQVALLNDQVNNKQSLVSSSQGAARELEEKVHALTLQVQQVTHERDQLKLVTNRSENSGRDLLLRLERLDQQVSDLTGQNRELTSQIEQVTFEKQQVTEQVTRSQNEVTDLRSQVTHLQEVNRSLTSQVTGQTGQQQALTSQVTATGQQTAKKQVTTARKTNTERAQATTGHDTPLDITGLVRDPVEVYKWVEAHKDTMTQAQMAEALKFSDPANMRRKLRKAQEILGITGQGEQVANDE